MSEASIMESMATTVAEGGAAALSQGGNALIASLVAHIRSRFQRDATEEEVVDGALASPDDPEAVSRLARLLERESLADPEFGRTLRAAWSRIARDVTATRGGVANSIGGEVTGSALQARDVHGGVSFGTGPRPPE